MMGTGWLIAPNLLVTAGHCGYDQSYGPVQEIKAYIGYKGRASVNSLNSGEFVHSWSV
jgi:V8-like Glu-specific endopeptidase